MKKSIFLAAACCIFFACQSNDPAAIQTITFNINTFSQSTEQMNAPAKAPQATILDDEGGAALTDLYVFDGTTLLVHQVYAEDNDAFGTVALDLTHGAHNLSFVATRSTGLSYDAGVLTATSLRSTFGKLLALNVTSTTPAQSVVLDRISGLLRITILDAFPAAASEIAFTINPRYDQLNIATLCGTNGSEKVIRTSCASKVGKSGEFYNINILAPSLTDEYTADVTITIYNAGGDAIYSVTVDDVHMAANTKTLLSGNLFTTPSATVSANYEWNEDIVTGF